MKKQTEKYQKKLKSGKLKYLHKYKIELAVISRYNKKETEEAITSALGEYSGLPEGEVLSSKEEKMTKAEIKDWVDFDEPDED